MQVGNSINSGYLASSYRRHADAKRNGAFSLSGNGDFVLNEAAENQERTETTDYQGFYEMFTSQRAFKSAGSAVTIAESEDSGIFIGLTMVAEDGEETAYGLRAMLSDKSTPDNPIVQIVTNFEGKKVIYNVEVNKVDPKNATQLEMFALLSYTDKMGLTDGGTFGSFHQLKTYAGNAAMNGYCDSLSGVETFLYKKFDWSEILKSIMKDYLEAESYKQYEECKQLMDFMNTVISQDDDNREFLQKKMKELLEKIQNGEDETSYKIGAQSFTEKEWDELLENFDSIEDMLRELMRERHEKQWEEKLEKERIKRAEEHAEVTDEEADTMLFTESTSCTYPNADPTGEDIRYITWYTEEGIFCRKAGQTEGYEWAISFENKEQYVKVLEFIGRFPSDANFQFAAQENFWRKFLKDDSEIDIDDFMEFMEGTNKGM